MSRGRRHFAFAQAQITKGALYILFAVAGISLLYLLGGDEMRAAMFSWLAATPGSVWTEFKVWQLVTSPLLEVDFISLIFQAFMLWMFLPALERWWGMKRFLLFCLYTSVLGTAVGTLVGSFLGPAAAAHPITGLDPFVFGGIVAYGVLFANHSVRFFGVLPMTGKQLTLGICAFVGLFILLGQQWAEGAAWASAMLLAWAMTSDKFSLRLWLLKRKQRKVRRHLRLVKDEKETKRWMN